MATSERRRDRALEQAARLRTSAGVQIRIARRTSGLSLRAAAAAVGIDFSTLARIERGALRNVSLEQLCLACAAGGLEPALRAFPMGDPVRDAPQQRLLARFRSRLPAGLPWDTEVPMPHIGDLRGLDARTRCGGALIGIEAETRLGDLQAIERNALRKQRDAGLDVMLLLVADTHFNRLVLATHRQALRGSFPFDTREVLRTLTAGLPPRANGIVVL